MKYIIAFLSLVILGLNSQVKAKEEHHDELIIPESMFEEIGISFTKIQKLAFGNVVTAHGEIIPTLQGYTKVGTLLSGRIKKINIQLGQYVKKGDILFEISSLEVLELMDDYFTNEAEYERAKKNFNRLKKLKEDGIGSDKDFFQAQSEYDKSRTQYESADRKIHAIGFTDDELLKTANNKKHRSELLTVKATISGYITQLSATKGQYVNTENVLAEILDINELWARIHIYEKDLMQINKGSKVEIISAINNNLKSFGTVLNKSRSFMDNKKSVEVIVSIDKPQGFVAGSNINANIYNQLGKESWVIPEQSIIEEDGEHFLFIRKSKDEFEKRKIIVGKSSNNYIQVLNGVNENDEIVENGTFYLKSLSKGDDIGGHDD